LPQGGGPGVREVRSVKVETTGFEYSGRALAGIAAMKAALPGLSVWTRGVTVFIVHALRSGAIAKVGEISKRFFIVITFILYTLPDYAARLALIKLY